MPIIGVIASSAKGAPAAPIIGTATDVGTARAFNNGAATVTFTPGAGATATSFTATSSPGGFTATGASSPLTVAGLQSGVAYTFTVTATNASGTSPASSASNSITATTVPQAPTIGTATAGNTTASVTFTANATGGKTVSTFTATSSPGSITGTNSASPITVSGLTNGTAYTFTVTATNANGTSAASAASNSVTPAIPTSYDSIATIVPSGSPQSVTFTNIPQSYFSLQLRSATQLDQTASGLFQLFMRMNGDTAGSYSSQAQIGGPSGFTGTSATTTGIEIGRLASRDYISGAITDIYEYANSSRCATVRSNSAAEQNLTTGRTYGFYGGSWSNTAAVTSITLYTTSGVGFSNNSSFALYGIGS